MSRRVASFFASILSFASLVAAPSTAQIVRVGTEFQANTYTQASQSNAAVGVAPSGAFVVVWTSLAQDGYSYGIFGRRFSSSGAALAAEFQVNTYTDSYQTSPAIAVGGDGRFVVAWTSYKQDGEDYGVFARRFDSSGAALATEFQVNLTTVAAQGYAAIGMAPGGSFVVAWESYQQDDSGSGVFARLFDDTGDGGIEIQVNHSTESPQIRPAVAVGADGRFVVAWESQYQDGSSFGVFLRRFDSDGGEIDVTDVLVNTYTADSQGNAAVDFADDGSFVVVWASAQDGFQSGIFGQRFSSAGAPLGGELPLNDIEVGDQTDPDVESDGGRGFLVVWTSQDEDSSGEGVFARRFRSSGEAQDGDVQVNLFTEDDQSGPSIGLSGGGRFVVAWNSADQDGSSDGVFAQRFIRLATLDVDGDGQVEPLTDGLLKLRFEFGFTGSTLITGAVDLVNCTRCDSPSILAYLNGLN